MATLVEEHSGKLDTYLLAALPAAPSLISNAPWWLVSAGLHVVLILAAALIYVERAMAAEEVPILAGIRQAPSMPLIDSFVPESKNQPGVITDEPPAAQSEDPVIINPFAKLGDHNESKGEDDHRQMLGKSKEFLSYLPGETPHSTSRQNSKNVGYTDVTGVGNGSGGPGRHGGPFGGREEMRKRGTGDGIKPKSPESAVAAALKWLALHQNADGSWGASSFAERCAGARCSGSGDSDFDAGQTGLAVLAFLGAGYSHLSRDEFPDPAQPARMLKYGDVVKNGVKWMIDNMDPEGCVGPRSSRYLYNHSIAALALGEAFGMTGSRILQGPAQKAIDFLVMAQNPGRGWRYSAKCGDNDSSVTGWAVMALKSAELSGLTFPKTAFDGALAWFDEATDKSGYSRVGYNKAGTGKVFIAGKNEHFDHHESMSAVAVMSRIFIRKDKQDPALMATHMLTSDLPEWNGSKIDFYYWYYASLALFQVDGPNGPQWKRWNEPLKNALVPHQLAKKDGCRNGSWDPEVDRWGFEGGRVYATAINALTLEVYYRYANVFGVSGK